MTPCPTPTLEKLHAFAKIGYIGTMGPRWGMWVAVRAQIAGHTPYEVVGVGGESLGCLYGLA